MSERIAWKPDHPSGFSVVQKGYVSVCPLMSLFYCPCSIRPFPTIALWRITKKGFDIMLSESLTQLIATWALIVFSSMLGFSFRSLGFGSSGLRDRLAKYETRRKTSLGKGAHRPLLVRHAENPYLLLFAFLAPTLVNGSILLWFYREGLYDQVPIITAMLVGVELFASRYFWRRYRSKYESDYVRYMRLTDPRHQHADGEIMDRDLYAEPTAFENDRLLKGGKIISFTTTNRDGSLRVLRLFFPLSAYPLPPDGSRTRIFYRPVDKVQGKPIHGVLIGCQALARMAPPPRNQSGTLRTSAASRPAAD